MALKPAVVGLRTRTKGGPSKFTLSMESETKQRANVVINIVYKKKKNRNKTKENKKQKYIISASHSRKTHSFYLCIMYCLPHHHQQQQTLLYAAKKETLEGENGKIIIKIITIQSSAS